MNSEGISAECRFCGLVLEPHVTTEFHDTCVETKHVKSKLRRWGAHPMYGLTPTAPQEGG